MNVEVPYLRLGWCGDVRNRFFFLLQSYEKSLIGKLIAKKRVFLYFHCRFFSYDNKLLLTVG